MKDALKGYVALASGLTEVTRQRATAAAKALVAQGEATAGQVTGLTDDLVAQSRSNREAVTALVKYEVDRTLGRVGLASADEVGQLTSRVRALETAVRELSQSVSTTRAAGQQGPTKQAAARQPVDRATASTTGGPPSKAAAAKAPGRAAAKAGVHAAAKAAPAKKGSVKAQAKAPVQAAAKAPPAKKASVKAPAKAPQAAAKAAPAKRASTKARSA